MNKAVHQYLDRYAEAEVALASQMGEFEHAIVLPVRDEAASCLENLELGWSDETLLIVIVNGDEEDTPETLQANQDFLREHDGPLVGNVNGRPRLVIDRASPARLLPIRRGVGLARKVGADIALALYAQGKLRSGWIHSTDADVILPDGYASDLPSDAVAATYAFEHVPSGEDLIDEATRIYDLTLRHYVEGLRWAGSPYAFHTVGSAIAFRAEAYAVVRGFPARAAGEDFYLLNKLAKVGTVARLQQPVIRIRSRASTRTPFGTGAAVSRFAQFLSEGQAPRTYDPGCFERLREWLLRLDDMCERGAIDLNGLTESVLEHVVELGTERTLERLFAQNKSSTARRRAVHEWFDGFRTLKLVHHVRDAEFPDVEWTAACPKEG